MSRSEGGLYTRGTMAAEGWWERVRKLLKTMNSFHEAGSSKALCFPFMVAGQQVGYVPPAVAKCLHQYPTVFSVSQRDEALPHVELNEQLTSCDQRTAAVQRVLKELKAQQAFPCLKGWRDEMRGLGTTKQKEGDSLLFLTIEEMMERAATPLLGVKCYGAHLNGYTWRNDEMHMWLARRALNKPTYPGLLDNLAAGGISSELGVRETLIKECQEEACIPASLATLSKSVGTISYTYEGSDGGIYPECQFVYDLELPEEFVPRVGDGEVQEFYLWSLDKVKEAIGSSDFKPNCAMVALDFLIRHSYIQPDQESHYVELVEGLHQSL
ncbi:hypothetical protein E2320_016459 [Naja naja]|nr:hypothetical protein E2320_016459 [Naja naja]